MLTPLLPFSDHLLSLLRNHSVFLFLDYDGTLTPIVNNPAKTKISASQKKILKALANCPNVRVAIVTGRSLPFIKGKIRIKSLIYMGNHGLEYEGPSMKHVHPTAAAIKHKMKEAALELRKTLKNFRGIIVEDKTFTLSVHYRALAEEKIMLARELVYRVIAPYLKSRIMTVRRGKKVWEIRPVTDWNKGKMVLWTLARFLAKSPKKIVPFYFGDDETDEDVFRILGKKGIGIRITQNPEEPSFAKYYLKSPDDVYRVLNTILKMRLSHGTDSSL